MVTPQHGLGRGLDALFRNGTLPIHEEKHGVSELPIFKLVPGAGQPRHEFDERALDELAASIKTQGIIQPLLVRQIGNGKYEIIAGERRWRAAQRAGLSTVPVIVRALSDSDALTIGLVENLQREDLNPVEEAQAMATLRDTLHLSQEAIAERIGKSRSAVANALRLLQLPAEMLRELQRGGMTPGHARALLSVADASLRMDLYHVVIENGLSVRQTEEAALHVQKTGALPVFAKETEGKPRTSKAARTPKDADIKALQLQLRAAIHPRITITGTKEAGRITLPYDSSDMLNTLLKSLM